MQLSENPFTPTLQRMAEAANALQLVEIVKHKARCARLHLTFEDFQLDATRQLVDIPILDTLLQLAQAANVEKRRDSMFSGASINNTEQRTIGHFNMRAHTRFNTPQWLELSSFSESIRKQKQIKNVVNIGIGGSDLGPAATYTALKHHANGPKVHFISNIDPTQLHHTLLTCKAKSTLFIIASKTFTTKETICNAALAREWLVEANISPASNMVAVTAAPEKAMKWGIDPSQIFVFPDNVGGRYSIWSAIGLSVMLSIGCKNFKLFLNGAAAMDKHFSNAPIAQNIPIIMALLRVWNRNFLGYPAHALIPYEQGLNLFPAWAQQLEMESNGKNVEHHGTPLTMAASPLIWGASGTNAQHSFFQYLHQGMERNPIDILLPRNPANIDLQSNWRQNHKLLLINAIAQAEALAFGAPDNLEPYQSFPGNRPSNLLSWDRTSPYHLGTLLALYESITIACGFIWGINSFDQWGIELGKKLADTIETNNKQYYFSSAAEDFIKKYIQH